MSVNCGWISRNSLLRYRPGLLYIEYAFLFFGICFWVSATIGHEGFGEETWGAFAYIFPAKVFAAFNMGASALCIIGLRKPIKTWMIAAGAALQCLQFSVISYSAIYTDGEMIVGLASSVLFLPLHMWLFYEAFARWKISPSISLCRQ